MKESSKFQLVAASNFFDETELHKRIARLLQNEFELQLELKRVQRLLDQAYAEKQNFLMKSKLSRFDDQQKSIDN